MEKRPACAGVLRGTAHRGALRIWVMTAYPCQPALLIASTAKVRLHCPLIVPLLPLA